jgi:L-glyceraldehyde 3-phosphate reductase
VFSPLAQGLLTNRYLKDIPKDSRAGKGRESLSSEDVTGEVIGKVRRLGEIAQQRGQSMAQMAIAWTLRDPIVTSAVFGASRKEQVQEIVAALENLSFTKAELAAIDAILAG